MRVVNAETNVQMLDEDPSLHSEKFEITMGPKMFTILSDGLYSDKITACIRELSANAYDSHVAAGCPNKPFDVYLPTWNTPEFYIRDYGTGMSKDTVFSLYKKYGLSSKESSNDYIGCLGLGSKTPFSYNTRTFNVTSWFGGTKSEYRCIIGRDGIPDISLVNENPSTEPTGVKISFPTARGDDSNFASKATGVYLYYKVKPNFVGYRIIPGAVSYSMKGSNWGIRTQTGNYYTDRQARLVMGNVSYPIVSSSLDSKYHTLCQSGIDIFANIGDVSVEVSREGLSYDGLTINHISGEFEDIIKEANKTVIKDIGGCKNLWEARKKFCESYENVGAQLRAFIDFKNIQFNGKVVYPDANFSVDINGVFSDDTRAVKYASRYRINKAHKSYSTYVEPSHEFYWNDLKIGGHVRCKNVIENDNSKTVFMFDFSNPTEKQALLDKLGMPDDSYIKPISSVPYTVVKSPRAKRGKLGSLLEFNSSTYHVTKQWKTSAVDLTLGGVYVEVDGYSVKNSKFSNETLRKVIEHVGITTPIYGVRTKIIGKVNTLSNWKHIDDFIKEELEKYLKINQDKLISDVVEGEAANLINVMKESFFSKSNNKELKQLCDEIKVLTTPNSTKSTYASHVYSNYYVGLYGLSMPIIEKSSRDITKRVKKVYSQYPLVFDLTSKIGEYYIKQCKTGIQHYIELVEKDLV